MVKIPKFAAYGTSVLRWNESKAQYEEYCDRTFPTEESAREFAAQANEEYERDCAND